MKIKRRSQLILSLLAKTDPDNHINAIGFKWSDLKEEVDENIALANFIEILQKHANKEYFSKK